MLNTDVDRYITLRRTLGFKLVKAERHLQAFARFAVESGDNHIRSASVLSWLASAARTPNARARRFADLIAFARFLHAEDPRHEIPAADVKRSMEKRPVPYIYAPNEIAQILDIAGHLELKQNPLRRQIHVMLFGLIAATGLRLSEALGLKVEDIMQDGVLHIRETKFRKSRLVPMHPTVVVALESYLVVRSGRFGGNEWLFPSGQNRAMSCRAVEHTFSQILRIGEIAPNRTRRPRIHDLRHTFATRALEQCSAERAAVARHFVALSTYLGHVEIRNTYWYLEATAEMLADIATAAEILVGEYEA